MDHEQASAPAGWYSDPVAGPSSERYWNGEAWTPYTRVSGSSESDADHFGSPAEIEVSRQFNLWMGIALAWDVFVDDTWMGTCKNGKTIRFQVLPGIRIFKVWTQGRKACSGDLQLDVRPGSVHYLLCRMNKSQLWAGYRGGYTRRFRYPLELRRQIQEAGGVNREGILLYEDERLIRPDWGGTEA